MLATKQNRCFTNKNNAFDNFRTKRYFTPMFTSIITETEIKSKMKKFVYTIQKAVPYLLNGMTVQFGKKAIVHVELEK